MENKASKALIVFAIIITSITMVFPIPAQAADIEVLKEINNPDISVGDNIEIFLRLRNPFSQELAIQVQDKNILGGNGLDIQCYEATLPPRQESMLHYSVIQAYQSGDFELGKATITYNNPETGQSSSIRSSGLNVTIKPSQSQQNLQQQGITTIYQCGGMNMQSTSIQTQQTGSQQQQQNQQQQQSQQPQTQPNIQQQNQDMNAVKKQLEQQKKEQEEMKQQLEQQIEQDQRFQEMEQELREQGYERQSKDITPESNHTGEFEYTYKNEQAEQASIQGNVQDGKMEDIQKWSNEELERLMELLENSTEYQQIKQQLDGQGFNLSAKQMLEPRNNVSNFDYSFNRTANSDKSIRGNITITGDIVSIGIYGENEGGIPLWLVLFIIIEAFVSILVYRRITSKKAATNISTEVIPRKKPFDYRKAALQRIAKAEKFFENGRMKEAYAKVSEGVRLYFKHSLKGQGKGQASALEEFTSTDILRLLKKDNKKIFNETKKCFEICDLVKFAKYKPNEKDFRAAVCCGKKAII